MLKSTVTSKGQTTIPKEIREALNLKPGDQLLYTVDSKNKVHIEVLQGAAALRGVLASDRGKGLAFSEVREVAASKIKR